MSARGPRIPFPDGRAVRASVAALSLLAWASCGGLGGGSASPVPYEELRGNLERAYDNLARGIENGTFDAVPSLCTALGAELDRVEDATKRWGILEREKLKLALATARRGLQQVSRTAPASGDAELLRAQLRPVGESVQEATALLEQAAAATKSPS